MAPAICVAVPLLAGLSSFAAAESGPTVGIESAFRDFVVRYERSYSNEAEEARRFAAFKENYAFIEAENAKGLSHTLGVNEFADLSREEFQATHLGLRVPEPDELWGGLPDLGVHNYTENSRVELPDSVDWVSSGKVTEVKSQGECGSCWTFSATGAIESAWAIAGFGLHPLSEQQILDCAKSDGCKGGSPMLAFGYLREHDICSEGSYPYKAEKQACQSSCSAAIPQGFLLGFQRVRSDSEPSLMSALSQQPVSVLVDANGWNFQFYFWGIIWYGCTTNVNHAVLLVGYGTNFWGKQFWKLKNSWGKSWGEHGYFRLPRGGDHSCMCGMCLQSSFPVTRKADEEGGELLV